MSYVSAACCGADNTKTDKESREIEMMGVVPWTIKSLIFVVNQTKYAI